MIKAPTRGMIPLSFSTPLDPDPSVGSVREHQITLMRALLQTPFFPGGPPTKVSVDSKFLKKRLPSVEEVFQRFKRDMSVDWEEGTRPLAWIDRAPDIIKVISWIWQGRAPDLADLLSDLPFLWSAVDSVVKNWKEPGSTNYYCYGPQFYSNHYSTAWAAAFKGEGHRNLVSRRWLDYGPWRLIRAPNDTSFIELHSLDVPDDVAFQQAFEALKILGLSPTGGYIPHRLPARQHLAHPELYTHYDATARQLIVPVHGRPLEPTELLEACIARRFYDGPEDGIDQVTFVFLEEDNARRHLFDLWLRDLGCRAIIDGREVDLLQDYEPPPPTKPDWVKQAQDLDGR